MPEEEGIPLSKFLNVVGQLKFRGTSVLFRLPQPPVRRQSKLPDLSGQWFTFTTSPESSPRSSSHVHALPLPQCLPLRPLFSSPQDSSPLGTVPEAALPWPEARGLVLAPWRPSLTKKKPWTPVPWQKRMQQVWILNCNYKYLLDSL